MNQYQCNIGYDDISQFLLFNIQKSSQFQMPPLQEQKQSVLTFPKPDLVNTKLQEKTSDKTVTGQKKEEKQQISVKQEKKTQIDYKMEIQVKNQRVKIGSKDDTVLLNNNFKTILVNYFKELLLANQLSSQQAKLVHEFSCRPPSFKSFLAFCTIKQGEEGINNHCINVIESSYVIQKILKSSCKMSTKLQMIKFIQVLRTNIKGKGVLTKWKQNLRDKKASN